MHALNRNRSHVPAAEKILDPGASSGYAVFAAVLAFLYFAPPVSAAPRDFAMGISLGSPMGISVLQNLGENEAIQGALEINIENLFVLHGDYLFKQDGLIRFDEAYGKAWLYYGPGVRFEWGDRDLTVAGPYRHADGGRFALRFPAGVQYYVPKVPFDVFAELAPMLGLWRSTNVDLTWALGLRFNL